MREKSADFIMKLKRSNKMFGDIMGVLLGVILLSHMAIGAQTHASASTPTPASTPVVTLTPEMETCQCGVFLLGTQPLVFSADAKPILSGMPVPANCSAREDKLQCATICRQLIETMSQSHEDSPLVQTVVLAATRTLACQRFNESEKVPLPRNFDGSPPHHARLDDQTNKWKFMVGPLARSELGGESDPHHNGDDNEADEDSERNYLRKLTQPKYLGGFYRWCDEHWIYAGISLHEPLCCLQHLPKKCPTPAKSARNGRRPRLIIRRCKNDDCSSEEDFQNLEISAETPSTSKTPPTTQSLTTDSEETETPSESFDNSTTSMEVETINPFDSMDAQKPTKNRKPLNSTVVAEAFKFVNSLMDSLGYGEFVQGITSVLPSSLASELIDRVDVGGWVSNYQDRYMKWPREFSMGYCYVEYSLYNMASDGFISSVSNSLSRVFKSSPPSAPLQPPSRSNMPPHHPGVQQPPPLPLGEVIQGSPPPYGNNPNNINNYISPMPPLPDNSFNAYGQPGLSGNRRVRRSPGVTVSRSYSSAVGGQPGSESSSSRLGTRRAVRRKIHRARNAPSAVTSSDAESMVPVPMEIVTTSENAAPLLAPVKQVQVHPSSIVGNNSAATSFIPSSSSFVPTNSQPQVVPPQSQSRYFTDAVPTNQQQQPTPLNPHYNQNQYYSQYDHQQQPQQQMYQYPQHFQQQHSQQQVPVQRSHQQGQQSSGPAQILTDYARPRRNPQGDYHQQQNQNQAPPPPRARQSTRPTSKEGPSAGSLMNIANMLVQTAMSGNNQNDGDKVTSIMQNALPLVSSVATNPAIQNMVSSLVTSFLTPPQAAKPTPPPSPPPSQNIDDEEEFFDSQEDNKPVKGKIPARGEPLESNEINDLESQPSRPSVSSSSPSGGSGGGDGSIISSMVSQMISTYIKHLFSPGANNKVDRTPPTKQSNRPSRPGDDSSKPQPESEKDVVEVILNTAKPFFISYFGVVPGEPGFGKLRISERRDRLRYEKDGGSGQYTDILTNDPDPGTGVMDILLGTVNIPETGNGVIDFGNRVVYAFSKGNDPQQGMYCFKQYTVNKLWDYFRVGVRAVFKK